MTESKNAERDSLTEDLIENAVEMGALEAALEFDRTRKREYEEEARSARACAKWAEDRIKALTARHRERTILREQIKQKLKELS